MRHTTLLRIAPWMACLTALLLFGCKSQKPNEVAYGGRSCYFLEEGEKRVDLGPAKVAMFEECCFTEGLNQPLNRAMEGPRFDSYISLVMGALPMDLDEAQKADPTIEVLDTKKFGDSKNLYDAWLLQKNGMYVCRVAFMEPKTDLLLVWDLVRNSEAEARAFYEDEAYLKQKLNCGKS